VSTVTAPAYGLRWTGLESDRWLAISGADDWQEMTLAYGDGTDPEGLTVDEEKMEARLGRRLGHDEVVHPLLGRIGSYVAFLRGGDAMHAGAVLGAAGVYAIVANSGGGKSTLLAGLARLGLPIVADDALVLVNGLVQAGPRSVDLRGHTERFGATTPVRPGDPRRRLELPPIAAEHPLAGVVHLEWGDCDPEVAALHHRDALAALVAARAGKGWPARGATVLDLAGLPTYVLRRRHSFDDFDAAIEMLRTRVLDA
jgi:hypothetical protein